MPLISDLHHLSLPWLAVILLMALVNGFWLYRHRRSLGRALVACTLAFALADSVAYRMIKPWVDRDRPQKAGVDVVLRVTAHSGQGFPSNHAANSFAVANTL